MLLKVREGLAAGPLGRAAVSGNTQAPMQSRQREAQLKSEEGMGRPLRGQVRLTKTSSSTPLVARSWNQRASRRRSAPAMKLQVRLAKGKGPGCDSRAAETAAVTARDAAPARAGRAPAHAAGRRWVSTKTVGAERQRPRQREESTVVRAPSLAGRRETTRRRSSSGRRLTRSVLSAAAAAQQREGGVEKGGMGRKA